MNLIIWGQYAAAIGAIAAVFGLIVKYGVLIPIKAYIDHKTYQIQPESNGGKSLSDVALGIEAIKLRLNAIERKIELIERDTPK